MGLQYPTTCMVEKGEKPKTRMKDTIKQLWRSLYTASLEMEGTESKDFYEFPRVHLYRLSKDQIKRLTSDRNRIKVQKHAKSRKRIMMFSSESEGSDTENTENTMNLLDMHFKKSGTSSNVPDIKNGNLKPSKETSMLEKDQSNTSILIANDSIAPNVLNNGTDIGLGKLVQIRNNSPIPSLRKNSPDIAANITPNKTSNFFDKAESFKERPVICKFKDLGSKLTNKKKTSDKSDQINSYLNKEREGFLKYTESLNDGRQSSTSKMIDASKTIDSLRKEGSKNKGDKSGSGTKMASKSRITSKSFNDQPSTSKANNERTKASKQPHSSNKDSVNVEKEERKGQKRKNTFSQMQTVSIPLENIKEYVGLSETPKRLKSVTDYKLQKCAVSAVSTQVDETLFDSHLISLPLSSITASHNEVPSETWEMKSVDAAKRVSHILTNVLCKLKKHKIELEEELDNEIKKLKRRYEVKIEEVDSHVRLYTEIDFELCNEIPKMCENKAKLNNELKIKILDMFKTHEKQKKEESKDNHDKSSAVAPSLSSSAVHEENLMQVNNDNILKSLLFKYTSMLNKDDSNAEVNQRKETSSSSLVSTEEATKDDASSSKAAAFTNQKPVLQGSKRNQTDVTTSKKNNHVEVHIRNADKDSNTLLKRYERNLSSKEPAKIANANDIPSEIHTNKNSPNLKQYRKAKTTPKITPTSKPVLPKTVTTSLQTYETSSATMIQGQNSDKSSTTWDISISGYSDKGVANSSIVQGKANEPQKFSHPVSNTHEEPLQQKMQTIRPIKEANLLYFGGGTINSKDDTQSEQENSQADERQGNVSVTLGEMIQSPKSSSSGGVSSQTSRQLITITTPVSSSLPSQNQATIYMNNTLIKRSTGSTFVPPNVTATTSTLSTRIHHRHLEVPPPPPAYQSRQMSKLQQRLVQQGTKTAQHQTGGYQVQQGLQQQSQQQGTKTAQHQTGGYQVQQGLQQQSQQQGTKTAQHQTGGYQVQQGLQQQSQQQGTKTAQHQTGGYQVQQGLQQQSQQVLMPNNQFHTQTNPVPQQSYPQQQQQTQQQQQLQPNQQLQQQQLKHTNLTPQQQQSLQQLQQPLQPMMQLQQSQQKTQHHQFQQVQQPQEQLLQSQQQLIQSQQHLIQSQNQLHEPQQQLQYQQQQWQQQPLIFPVHNIQIPQNQVQQPFNQLNHQIQQSTTTTTTTTTPTMMQQPQQSLPQTIVTNSQSQFQMSLPSISMPKSLVQQQYSKYMPVVPSSSSQNQTPTSQTQGGSTRLVNNLKSGSSYQSLQQKQSGPLQVTVQYSVPYSQQQPKVQYSQSQTLFNANPQAAGNGSHSNTIVIDQDSTPSIENVGTEGDDSIPIITSAVSLAPVSEENILQMKSEKNEVDLTNEYCFICGEEATMFCCQMFFYCGPCKVKDYERHKDECEARRRS